MQLVALSRGAYARRDLVVSSDIDTENSEGAIGGAAQAVGGPFSSDGAIGKVRSKFDEMTCTSPRLRAQNFTSEGSIGGSVHNAAESMETGTAKNRVESQEKANQKS